MPLITRFPEIRNHLAPGRRLPITVERFIEPHHFLQLIGIIKVSQCLPDLLMNFHIGQSFDSLRNEAHPLRFVLASLEREAA